MAAQPASGADLDEATALVGDGQRFSTVLSEAWEIWGPNGGYLAALALRAAGVCAEIDHPASLYCHFLRSPEFDGVELEVEHLRRSRRAEAISVQMTQGHKPVLQALVRTAAQAPGYEYQHSHAPSVPRPEDLRATEELWREHERPPFRFWKNLERRPVDQGYKPMSPGNERRDPVVREWVRYRPTARFGDPFVDAMRALILLDTYGWPAAFRALGDGTYIAPNLDTAVWFHQFSPSSEWLLIDQESVLGARGLLGVRGNVWDLDGRLLATGGSQLCCIPA